MFFDPNRGGHIPPIHTDQQPPGAPPPGAPDQRRVTQAPPDPAPRTGGSTLDFDVAPLSTRSVTSPPPDVTHAEKLDARPGSSIGKEAGQSNADVRATDEEVKALVGKAIDPRVAAKYAAMYPYPFIVNGREHFIFDGFGRLTPYVYECGLRRSEVKELAAAVIKPLTQVNSPHPRDAPRIETEILFEAVVAIRKTGLDEHSVLEDALLNRWLAGSMRATRASLLEVGARLEEQLKNEHDPTRIALLGGLLGKISTLAEEAEAIEGAGAPLVAHRNYSQHHDNVVGRRFESELVMALVEKPPKAVLKASRAFGVFLAAYVAGLARRNPELLPRLARRLRDISTPYADKLPHLRAFIANPTPLNFREAIVKCDNGYDIMKQSLVCGQLKNAWRDVQGEYLDYAEKGLEFAWNVIEATRHSTPSVSSGVAFVHPIFRRIINISGASETIEKWVAAYASGKTRSQRLVAELNAFIEAKEAAGEPLAPSDEALNAPELTGGERDALQQKLAQNQNELARRLQDVREAFRDESNLFKKAMREAHAGLGLAEDKRELEVYYNVFSEAALTVLSELGESFLAHPAPLRLQFEPRHFSEDDPTAPALVETEVKPRSFRSDFPNTSGVGFGTALPHQPKNDPGWDKWRLYPFAEHADVVNPSYFERGAFERNRYISRGASGSTVAMYNAFRECDNAGLFDINVGDAMVGTIMFMTFDSGHSMADSMGGLSAYRAYEEAGRDLEVGRGALYAFDSSYFAIDMSELGSSEETQLAIDRAIDTALDKTLKWFEDVHNERVAPGPGSGQ
jgi:hypothetical protein